MRLDKLLADRGYGTRKEIKKLLQKNSAIINGVPTKDGSAKVVADDRVEFLGDVISCESMIYYLFHKPAGCVCANEDALHPTIFHYIPNPRNQLFSVGRLDIDTEGLLLITNDGALAHNLLSPRHHVDKVYYARLDHAITEADIQAFQAGLDIGDDTNTMPADLSPANEAGDEIYVTIKEGRYHQVKRMFEARGNAVCYLKRMSMGPFVLDDTLPAGSYRPLTPEEMELLSDYTNQSEES